MLPTLCFLQNEQTAKVSILYPRDTPICFRLCFRRRDNSPALIEYRTQVPRHRLRALSRVWRLGSSWVLTSGLILFTLGPVAPATAEAPQAQLAAHFRAGQEALRQGEFVRATDEFKKVLALDPSLVEAEVNLGLAYQSLFEYDSSVRHLQRAF